MPSLASTPSATATAAQPPQPATEPSVADAAKAYLQAADESNRPLATILARIRNASRASDAAAFSAALNDQADEFARFQAKLVAISFPPQIQPAADELTKAIGRSIAASQLLAAQASTSPDLNAYRQASADTSSATLILRARLGLPPPPDL